MPMDDDDIFSDYSGQNEDVMGSDFRESNDSSSYGVSKDADISGGKSIKSKQMRSVLQTIEAYKKKVLESSDYLIEEKSKVTRRSGGNIYGKQLSQK